MEDAVPDPKVITIDALDPDTMALWRTVAKIAQTLGDHEVRWCLVGGLMVALFAIEAGQVQRPTTDIDILGDARQRPSGTMAVTERLRALGGEVREVSGMEHEKGFRFDLDGQIVDVLAPDGLAAPPVTRGRMQTIQIPGGSQALRRTEAVQILVEDQRAMLRRPTLVAAILLKARRTHAPRRPAPGPHRIARPPDRSAKGSRDDEEDRDPVAAISRGQAEPRGYRPRCHDRPGAPADCPCSLRPTDRNRALHHAPGADYLEPLAGAPS